jgi:hypothetical protein
MGYLECLELENESFRRLHADNIRYQDALQSRNKVYQQEIELLHKELRALRDWKIDALKKFKELEAQNGINTN